MTKETIWRSLWGRIIGAWALFHSPYTMHSQFPACFAFLVPPGSQSRNGYGKSSAAGGQLDPRRLLNPLRLFLHATLNVQLQKLVPFSLGEHHFLTTLLWSRLSLPQQQACPRMKEDFHKMVNTLSWSLDRDYLWMDS